MRVWPLVLAISVLLTGGCVQQSRMTAMKLPELSADPEQLPFVESSDDGFYGGMFPGRVPAGRRAGGVYTYELYYLLTVGGGGALCREARFKLRGIVVESNRDEITAIRFLKEFTGLLSYTPNGVIPSDLSSGSSFSIPDPARAVRAAPNLPAAAFAVRYQPPDTEPANAFSLVFELRLSPHSAQTPQL